ncbi:hypothetical protein TARUN_2890 [Trichoderma arundinaceum]|uniref:Uncharacterized protein n=1 Tax=Trichoderma arundinaceum TaxID=490622 RepID=A0A395NTC9_TRIAR|nr:hypothetical protein TARUN_2890 [Trichoderma arundinaceum]
MSDSQQTQQATEPLKPILQKPDAPESVQAIHDQLEEVAREYNAAVESGNKELATELRAKLNNLRKQAQDEGKVQSIAQAGDVYEMWIEIHNTSSSRTLRNAGGWVKDHGWWESAAVGDIGPGGVAYIHMGGGLMYGLDCVAYFKMDGDSSDTWFQWWYGPYKESMHAGMWSPSHYSSNLDGNKAIAYFYVG